jgi:hypothetical protein
LDAFFSFLDCFEYDLLGRLWLGGLRLVLDDQVDDSFGLAHDEFVRDGAVQIDGQTFYMLALLGRITVDCPRRTCLQVAVDDDLELVFFGKLARALDLVNRLGRQDVDEPAHGKEGRHAHIDHFFALIVFVFQDVLDAARALDKDVLIDPVIRLYLDQVVDEKALDRLVQVCAAHNVLEETAPIAQIARLVLAMGALKYV